MIPTLGSEFTVNPLLYLGALKMGLSPSIAALNNGNLAITWQDATGADGDVYGDYDIYVRLFKTDGTPLTDAIKVNSEPGGSQGDPEITALEDGGFLVGWSNVNSLVQGADNDVYFRAFNANGTARGEQVLASEDHTVPAGKDGATYNDSDNGDVLALENGDAIVLYTHRGEDVTYAHLVTEGGTVLGDAVQVFDVADSAVTMTQLANGDIVMSYPSYSYNGVVVRISGPDLVSPPKGMSGASEPLLISYFNDGPHDQTPDQSQYSKAIGDYISALPGGGFVMGYSFDPDIRSDTPVDNFRIDWFDNRGNFVRSADIPYPGTDESTEYDSGRVIGLSNDRVLVIFQIAVGYGDYDLKAQLVDADGSVLGEAIEITTHLPGNQLVAEETVLPDGSVAIVFVDLSGTPLDGTADSLHGLVLTIPDSGGTGGGGTGGGGTGGSDPDPIRGTKGKDLLEGTGRADTIKGLAGNDTLKGNGGNDLLDGGGGRDRLIGGGGNDTLQGGTGKDRMTGGTGADTFVFTSPKDVKGDLITDFKPNQGDLIDLSKIDANTTRKGNQEFVFIGEAEFSGTAGELQISSTKNKTFIAADTNGDGEANFVLTLNGTPTLSADDFIL